jgi:uncharacterized membrane protein
MLATLAAAALLGGLMLGLRLGPPPLAPLASGLVLTAGFFALYLRAHFRSRRLAAPVPALGNAAFPGGVPASMALPLSSLAVALIGGIVAVGYAWINYPNLPELVPTHFGPSGRPDAWSPRSFSAVMVLPLTTFLLGVAMAIAACLTARAKRTMRHPDGGASLAAQQRFRQASANLMALIVIVMTAMLTMMSIYAVRTSLGLASGMPPAVMAMVAILLVLSVGGGLFIALRYGQGGARLEREAAAAGRLTDGLADNSRWVLGAFYVNRDDPSVFVEKRFGLGYTINFGNPRAVALLVAFLAIVLFVVVIGVTMPQAR